MYVFIILRLDNNGYDSDTGDSISGTILENLPWSLEYFRNKR